MLRRLGGECLRGMALEIASSLLFRVLRKPFCGLLGNRAPSQCPEAASPLQVSCSEDEGLVSGRMHHFPWGSPTP